MEYHSKNSKNLKPKNFYSYIHHSNYFQFSLINLLRIVLRINFIKVEMNDRQFDFIKFKNYAFNIIFRRQEFVKIPLILLFYNFKKIFIKIHNINKYIHKY